MTDRARIIFSKLLDLNHEVESKETELANLKLQYYTTNQELKQEMGKYEYDKFMDAGKKMFKNIEEDL